MFRRFIKHPFKMLLLMILVLMILGVFGFVAINLYVFNTSRICSESRMSSYLDKKELLLTTESPRIIIIGDSSMAHGIDSAALHDIFGMPVVNTSIQGGMGMLFWTNVIKPYINENDIVILSFTHKHWIENGVNRNFFYGDPIDNILWQVLVLDKETIQQITSVQQLLIALRSQFEQLNRRMTLGLSVTDTCVGTFSTDIRSAFNAYGDYEGHLNRPSPKSSFRPLDFGDLHIPEYIFGSVNEFAEDIKNRGASIYFLPSPLLNTTYQANVDTINGFLPLLKQNLDFPVLGDTDDFIYDDSLMYDSSYHLNTVGRIINTRKTIQLLSQYIMH